jgi:hypothetical protein
LIIDSEIAGKIKRAMAYNIINDSKDKLMENKAQVNIIPVIDHTVNECNSTKNDMHIELIGHTQVKIVYD